MQLFVVVALQEACFICAVGSVYVYAAHLALTVCRPLNIAWHLYER